MNLKDKLLILNTLRNYYKSIVIKTSKKLSITNQEIAKLKHKIKSEERKKYDTNRNNL